MIEVQLVNSVAPLYYAIASEVIKIIRVKKHIINVSAMEGKFHRFFKKHVIHTLIWLKLP
jgi:hypothetical protein